MGLTFNYKQATPFLSDTEIRNIENEALEARETLLKGTGEGRDFLGWVDLPLNYDKEEFSRIKKAAQKIRKESEVFVVIGIGGSYLGAKAALEFLKKGLYNNKTRDQRGGPEIYFCGNSISTVYIKDIIDVIGDRDFSVNIISKSGTTTEPAVAFRVFRKLLEQKYGKAGAASRIYATTDKEKGALKKSADKEGYETFVIPDNVGGRFSVLTAVGLLPIAVSGANIDKLMLGAQKQRDHAINDDFKKNPALLYAALRNIMLRKGKSVEILANYDPCVHYVSEWWKQLYGESEGKDHKGLFPAAVDLTTDLHSLGQFIQDGSRIMFETIIDIKNPGEKILVEKDEANTDGLNYLQGEAIDYINRCAMKGTILAHTDGGVPNFVIKLERANEEALGRLFYFFEFACGVSGYMLGVNPFNQPGVESYKKNMFALLGKPGYEHERDELLERL
ncbi:MAG: glucose-6-phosphate isomerase [Lachnospiraceae bacterium]|nr:glucose-6-phosphate isomerase [Lachnospiraceae bacterium]